MFCRTISLLFLCSPWDRWSQINESNIIKSGWGTEGETVKEKQLKIVCSVTKLPERKIGSFEVPNIKWKYTLHWRLSSNPRFIWVKAIHSHEPNLMNWFGFSTNRNPTSEPSAMCLSFWVEIINWSLRCAYSKWYGWECIKWEN